MKLNRLFYVLVVFAFTSLMPACSTGSGGTDKDESQVVSPGGEILRDAQTYAEKQCVLERQIILLKNNPKMKDRDQRLQELKQEKKKLKNYYMKKYAEKPEERVAFQRAVKMARRDSDLCRNMPKLKK